MSILQEMARLEKTKGGIVVGINTKFSLGDIVLIKTDVDQGLLMEYQIVSVAGIYQHPVEKRIIVMYQLTPIAKIDEIPYKIVAGFNLYRPCEITNTLQAICNDQNAKWKEIYTVHDEYEFTS